ncbi:MAG: hypothetical protein P8H42_04960 [Saprospiraceae bacterium]|nr:hypothetical protein [Saprospiraceae bacterium]
MIREPISYYLKNPSKLVDLSLSEIEKWLQESPFSQPIRALLAKKLIFDQEIVLDPVIIGAASTASNRTWLYRELHSGIEFKTDSSTASAEAVENVEIFNDHSTPITENNESIYTLDENIQDIENKVISNDIKEEVLEDRDEDGAALDLEGQLKETNEEIAIEQLLSIKQEKSSEDSKATSEIQVIRVDTDKEFIAGRDDDKKKAKKKKKDKKKIKKDKNKKADKKSEEKDKKKKKTAKKAKKKAKREKREPSENKALDVFWDEKEEIAHSKQKKEKASKRKFKIKNKKSKIQLLKYDIPVSPYEEEANHYDHDLDDLSELSNYTQWLLHFSKDKADGSFNHMWIASSKSNNGRENISTPSSEAKKKEKKSKNRAKKIPTKAKKKSKPDHSLETNEKIISELWADLLAKQGHIKKARKMYLKLSLKYPEKSSYFAVKLENL